MIILSIETSADETSVSIVDVTGDFPHAEYKILGNALHSQIELHNQYGGIFPAMAKREHAKAVVPLLHNALQEAELLIAKNLNLEHDNIEILCGILSREAELADTLITFLETYSLPKIDLIAVTSGPGLEPALWVGISFAKALAYITKAPLIPVNHMEGHVLSSVFTEAKIPEINFPALALLISGGHTELVRMDDFTTYAKVGETRDDAVGEAFDKVARMLGLPYPGGPEIGTHAKRAREENLPQFIKLPRPMLDADNLDFSFSGLKTAVRYGIGDKKLTADETNALARDFEDAVTEVLLKKSKRAIDAYNIQTLIIGGGVSANTFIRETFIQFFKAEYPHLAVYFPPRKLSTDNSIMIALAGHAHINNARTYEFMQDLKADGNLVLGDTVL